MSLYLVAANCENLPELDWWKTVKCRMSVSKVSESGKKIVVYDKEIDKRKFDWSEQPVPCPLHMACCAHLACTALMLMRYLDVTPMQLFAATIWTGAGRSLYHLRKLASSVS